jgi:hypothetical protein
MGPDTGHASAVVLRMLDDPSSRFVLRDRVKAANMRGNPHNASQHPDVVVLVLCQSSTM